MRITYDWDGDGRAPEPNDVLRTVTGRTYIVERARQVRSRVHPSRHALDVHRSVALHVRHWCADHPGARVFNLRWKPRGRRGS